MMVGRDRGRERVTRGIECDGTGGGGERGGYKIEGKRESVVVKSVEDGEE